MDTNHHHHPNPKIHYCCSDCGYYSKNSKTTSTRSISIITLVLLFIAGLVATFNCILIQLSTSSSSISSVLLSILLLQQQQQQSQYYNYNTTTIIIKMMMYTNVRTTTNSIIQMKKKLDQQSSIRHFLKIPTKSKRSSSFVMAFTTTTISTTTPLSRLVSTKNRRLVIQQQQQQQQEQRHHLTSPFLQNRSTRWFSKLSSSSSSSSNADGSNNVTATVEAELINGNSVSSIQEELCNSHDQGRYSDLLHDLDLQDDVSYIQKHIGSTKSRSISPYDIFCNREIKLSKIRAIGFDMDYTLAQYQQPQFDTLAFNGAKQKLVSNLGYPDAVLDFTYDHTLWTRGLIIDTQRGNFLKIDRHKYVRVAYHGFEQMSSSTRKFLYSRTFNKVLSFSEKHFVNMDTLFQFVDAHLFACLIQLKDEGEYDTLDMRTYEELYKHVRECVDLCHRDGVIKNEVHKNPSQYIVHDPGLLPMLRQYKQQGIKLFLLTNSLWEYTSTAMNYLYHGKRVPDEQQKKNEWLELFDLVIVGSCKPAYMVDPYLNLFRVNIQDGSLFNTDGLYEIDALGINGATKFLHIGKTFQGGNWLHLQAMLEIEAGEEILYVGDHLYSDVLRSKRTLGWRSAFIMPELEEEIRVFASVLPIHEQITSLRNLRDEIGIYIDHIQQFNPDNVSVDELDNTILQLTNEDKILKSKLQELTNDWHAAFHPIWGAMFNAGYQDSRFAFYVSNYACLYTSRATNLGLTSIQRSFRTSMEALPHDRMIALHQSSTNDILLNNDNPWEKKMK